MNQWAATGEGWQVEGSSAEAYERYLASAFSPWASSLVKRAGVGNGERVLDVACGTGIVARHAASAVGPGGIVVGLDLNDEMLRVAREVSAGVSPMIEWRQGNAAELPFPAAAFDVVLCEQAIQFFSDAPQALGEMLRVLAPGGRAAASVCRPIAHSPTYVTLANALEQHVGPDAGAMMRSPFSRWSVDQLRALFTAAGFLDTHVWIEVATLRYPSIAEYLRREAASSPLAAPVGALPPEARANLIRTLEVALADHVDDDGVVCPIEAFVVLAHRTS